MNYYFESTNRPVILLLHGFLGNKNQWDPIVTVLEKRFDLLMIELPGHGESLATTGYSITDLALEIAQYLEQHAIDKIHFIGHSMGGYIGAAFAKSHLGKLISLTLVNSITSADLPARKQMRNRAIQLIDRFQDAYVSMAINNLFTIEERESHKEMIENMITMSKSMTVESVLAALRAMRDRPSQQLSISSLSIQYIYGSRDTIIDKSLINKELCKYNCEANLLDGGHMLLLTHPEELLDALHFVE